MIYDLTDPMRVATIYADTARLTFAQNRVDLNWTSYSGEMQDSLTDKPTQLDRLFYRRTLKMRDVGGHLQGVQANPQAKGDREMGICEMQKRYGVAQSTYASAQQEYDAR